MGNTIPITIFGAGEEVDAINLVVEVGPVAGDAPSAAIESLLRTEDAPFSGGFGTDFSGSPVNTTNSVGTAWLGPTFGQPFPLLPASAVTFANLSIDTSAVGPAGATWSLTFLAGSGKTDIQRAGGTLSPTLQTGATIQVDPIPEPSTLGLLLVGFGGLFTSRIVRNRRRHVATV